jgi:hypothetical protein
LNPNAHRTLPLGIVLRRTPGVTRWVAEHWRASAVLPGAGQAEWRELRREGPAVEYHVATVTLELHGADTEAYLHGLTALQPSVYVVLREADGDADAALVSDSAGARCPLEVVLATVSPYEAQDYCDSGEEIVEKVPMPAPLRAWVEAFVTEHHAEEAFVKRKRDKKDVDLSEDGIGDARIAQTTDVYASPARKRMRVN